MITLTPALPESKLTTDVPAFASYKPDIEAINKVAAKYKDVKNIIVIGNGGSITSFHYFATALGTEKNIKIIATMEPEVLKQTKENCRKQDSVVIAISKSGNTIGVIEALLAFTGYPLIIVTENKPSAMKQMQETYGCEYLEHPPIGGRYSGFTPSGLLPAAIAGLDIEAIWKGAARAFNTYAPDKENDAKRLAGYLHDKDIEGYNEIFMPIYSTALLGSKDIITQLIHESVGKNKKGQTVIAAFAPESQHHTNQRFFGGKQNMVGCFITVEEHDAATIEVPGTLQHIPLRDGTIADLHNKSYSHALYAEYAGTQQDADQQKIPNVTVTVKKITPESVGAYLAFWQYTTVYLCVANKVNPFDQPQVESSKEISFKMRLEK